MPPAEVVPVAEPVVDPARYEAAAALLERAAGQDPNVVYLLFLAYKRQGKITEARNTLRKIQKPDANVILQMGLLSLAENNLAQAEGELTRAWSMDPTSYETCYNLLLTQLTLGKVEGCLALVPKALALQEQRSDEDERRFLHMLHALLQACRKNAAGGPDAALGELSPADEQRLLRIVRSLGQLDTMLNLLRALSEARPRSMPVREAYIEAVLVKGKDLLDRCHWTEAELLLRPFARERGCSRTSQIALLNLLGCCSAMTQDFDGALKSFQAAVKLAPNDVRLQQNAALAHELCGDLSNADPHWNRYFDLMSKQVPGPDLPEYHDRLVFEALNRLAGRYAEKERWNNALGYMQRAVQLRPNDADPLERLFHLYNQAKRTPDARRTLNRLRDLKPQEALYELYELDLIEVKGLGDIERLLNEIDRIRRRHPDDARVEERAVGLVSNVMPLMVNLCDQLTDQLGKVIDQVRHLPNYQINWAAVREVMRDLLKEFQKLRRITGKCLPLVTSEEAKRDIRGLAEHIDRKMEACRSMGA